MPVQYFTKNLNEKMYRRLIENIVLHLKPRPHSSKQFLDKWMIRIRPLDQTNIDFFNHLTTTDGTKINPKMPSGVTGQYVMDLFLHDSTNEFKFRENSDRIQHEICHALLYGTPLFVRGVHDKITNTGSYLKQFKFRFWTDRWKVWKWLDITVIDIRDDIR